MILDRVGEVVMVVVADKVGEVIVVVVNVAAAVKVPSYT